MGLDIYVVKREYEHAFRAGSYSGFSLFRDVLAAEDNILLDEMYGYSGGKSWESVESALRPILDHSDCDGDLYSHEVVDMIPRLEEIVMLWRSGYFAWEQNKKNKKLSDDEKNWYAGLAEKWLAVCRRIVKSEEEGINEHIAFC